MRRARLTQPFNVLSTTSIRWLLNLSGLKSEKVIKHLHRTGTVRCRLPNGRTLITRSNADDWVSNQIFWRDWHGYEPEVSSLFFQLATQSQLTLDVGAHVGFYSLLAAHANPIGRVFAFEPFAITFERLQRNVRLNRLLSIECIAAAVGESSGVADFFYTTDGIPCSSSLSLEFMSKGAEPRAVPVPVVAIDDFVAERALPRVDLVKLDIESGEAAALRGMMRTLKRDRPHLICEVLTGTGREHDLDEIVTELGYARYHLTDRGPKRTERITPDPVWSNYLLTATPDHVVASWWAAARA